MRGAKPIKGISVTMIGMIKNVIRLRSENR
jgi:hypothetical protein